MKVKFPDWECVHQPSYEVLSETGETGCLHSRADHYFASFFYASMAVLMVGINDNEMSNQLDSEKWMFIAAFFVGAIIMSLIIGNMSDIIAHSDPGATEIKIRCEPLALQPHSIAHHTTLCGHHDGRH
jgi:hypothetical protein